MHSYQPGLGGRVVAQLGCAELAQHRGDCDDVATIRTLEHGWQEGADCVEVGEQIYVEVPLELLGREGEEGGASDDAGVVDEDGGCAELGKDLP